MRIGLMIVKEASADGRLNVHVDEKGKVTHLTQG